ncbi:CST, telomere maintenance, complex subunit CTC1-domain-containing protein [Fimicolochytrium jonesii]|uniref:CST, telomere maintenance, complex subunit CTC1-domain-containing protein n=1 Tax=Fimicolochytrium jonesii TaxID=1396493 RepID=UPI0022FE5379|nr:CST, telomere maintenance, complex subunit CTC1-domain-containing protein [Fimicolochytrium jonesii]KAI8823706.1 CST, telomere maintenance, complex subunit CTC1-domain-containing protein [Fimicolochytrium jonesii]
MSWMVVRGNSVGEGRSTCIEVNPSGEGRQTWNLDATYLVTGAQLVGGIGNRTHPDSAGGPAFYKMTASTIVSSLAEPEGGTATTSNMAGTTSNQATNTFQLAKYDADRIALARTHPIFRSVGAVINRHVDTQAGPDTFQDYLVNLEGILEHREFRDKEADAFLSVDMAKALFETHTFGSGRNDRILFIRLRDKEDPETIGVYLDMRLHPYPVGLLPGALVQFQRLAIRMSGRGALYGHHIANTSITVSNPPLQPDTATKPTDEPPVPVHLHSFLPPHRTPCHVKLDITFVQEITIGPICTLCGSKPQHAGCPNACPAAHQTLQASARAFAQDGTCEALLYLDDRDTVFALLRVLAGPGSGGEAVLGRLVRAEKEVRFVQTPPWFADDGGGGNGRGAGTAGGERDEDMDAAGRGDEYFPAAANSRGSRAVGAHLADRDTDLQEVLTTYCQHLDLRRPVLARCRRVMRHRGPAEEFRKRTFKVANIAVPTIAHQRLLLKVLHMEGLDVKNEISRLTKILAARRIAIASGGDQ